MDYCWVMRLHEGRIAHVTGYYDSVKMTALFRD
jgi:ketosteroid isomerase-like protein